MALVGEGLTGSISIGVRLEGDNGDGSDGEGENNALLFSQFGESMLVSIEKSYEGVDGKPFSVEELLYFWRLRAVVSMLCMRHQKLWLIPALQADGERLTHLS